MSQIIIGDLTTDATIIVGDLATYAIIIADDLAADATFAYGSASS